MHGAVGLFSRIDSAASATGRTQGVEGDQQLARLGPQAAATPTAAAVDLQRRQGHQAVQEDGHPQDLPAATSRCSSISTSSVGPRRTRAPARSRRPTMRAPRRRAGAAVRVRGSVAVRRLDDDRARRRHRRRAGAGGWRGRPRSPLTTRRSPSTSSSRRRGPEDVPGGLGVAVTPQAAAGSPRVPDRIHQRQCARRRRRRRAERGPVLGEAALVGVPASSSWRWWRCRGHDRHQLSGVGRADDPAGEPVAHQARQVAAVVPGGRA